MATIRWWSRLRGKSYTVSEADPLPVTTAARGSTTDRSGVIGDANVSQEVAAANLARNYFLFENISDTDMWVALGDDASAGSGSYLVKSGGGSLVWESGFIPTDSINVLCAVDAKAFTATEG